MIAHIRGEVLSVGLDHVVISCSGVGYRLHATLDTLSGLRQGQEAGLHTHLVVREDSMTLYGFSTADECQFFEVIQSISGIGPRLALAMLGVLSPAQASNAIINNEPKVLQQVSGIGPKVAQRIVLELQSKVAPFAETGVVAEANIPVASVTGQQVVQGLIGLGYAEKAADQAVNGVIAKTPELGDDSAQLLRAALRVLSGGKS